MHNIHIILVQPIYKGNVGTVSRIMHNFQFANLRIVGNIPEKEDYVMGVHSEKVLDNAQVFDTLEDAIKDIDRAIAFSRRVGNKKKIDLLPADLCRYISDSPNLKIALVFGRENNGLTDEEANLCHLRCHIPANPDFPSINLAQAVAVILYHIYSVGDGHDRPEFPIPNSDTPTQNHTLTDTLTFAMQVLADIGSIKDEADHTAIESTLKSLLYRANCSNFMARDIKKIFNRIYLAFNEKGKGYKK